MGQRALLHLIQTGHVEAVGHHGDCFGERIHPFIRHINVHPVLLIVLFSGGSCFAAMDVGDIPIEVWVALGRDGPNQVLVIGEFLPDEMVEAIDWVLCSLEINGISPYRVCNQVDLQLPAVMGAVQQRPGHGNDGEWTCK